MELTWADKLEVKYREEGLLEGRQEGRQEGRRDGRLAILTRLMEKQLGPLPTTVRQRVRKLESTEELDQLADRILTTRSWSDLGLD